MDRRAELVRSCAEVAAPPPTAAAAYAAKQELLAEEVSRRLLQREDAPALIGAGNEPMVRDNHRNHARFIAAQLGLFSPQLLVDTLHWAYRTYLAHGFSPAYWPAMLPLWLDVMQRELDAESFAAVSPLYRWIVEHHEALLALASTEPSAIGEGGGVELG